MLDFKQQEPKIRIDFKDADTGIHISIQETLHRNVDHDKCFWISAHYEKDRHYNSIELSTATLDEAKAVATKIFDLMKELRPQLQVIFKEGDTSCGCTE